MTNDLATVNTALAIMAAVSVIQLMALVAIAVWVRRVAHRAEQAIDDVRPMLDRLGRTADEVDNVVGSISDFSDDARHMISSVRNVASSVAPALMPRAWVAGKLLTWAAHRRARRLAMKMKEQTDVEST